MFVFDRVAKQEKTQSEAAQGAEFARTATLVLGFFLTLRILYVCSMRWCRSTGA